MMMLSMMAVVHEQVHQRAKKDDEQRRNSGKMRAAAKGQIDGHRRDKQKTCQPFWVCEAAERVSPPHSDEEYLIQRYGEETSRLPPRHAPEMGSNGSEQAVPLITSRS